MNLLSFVVPPSSFIQWTNIFIVPTSVTCNKFFEMVTQLTNKMTISHVTVTCTYVVLLSIKPQNLIASFGLCISLHSDGWAIVAEELEKEAVNSNGNMTAKTSPTVVTI